jgi:hypothetical protein
VYFIPEIDCGSGMNEAAREGSQSQPKRRIKMKLSPPKMVTWIIAVIFGVLGILGEYAGFGIGFGSPFLFVAIGFVLLALATMVDGL